MQVWIAGYQQECDDATINYDPIGSGGGRSQFIDGAVTFAGTDAALHGAETEEARDRCAGATPVNLPAFAVPIAVVYHVDGIDAGLNLAPDTIAGLFNQDITRWDDPAIAEDNPDIDLPDTAVQPVSRSDESGTTENFTEYLHAAASETWPHDPGGQWPIEPAEAGQGNSGVAAAVEGGDGMIGYVEVSHAGELDAANVGVGDAFVAPSPEAAGRVVAEATPREDNEEHDLALDLDYGTTAADTYPIVLIAYEVACLGYDDATEVDLLTGFLSYVVSEEGQRAASAETGSALLPESVREDVQDVVDVISVD